MTLIGRFILFLSYLLQSKETYSQTKEFLRYVLEDEKSLFKKYYDAVMMTLVIITVVILIYSVKHPDGEKYIWIDGFAVALFVIEYLLRFWVSSDIHTIVIQEYERATVEGDRFEVKSTLLNVVKSKWDFIISPFSVIDLLAILPSLGSESALKGFIVFRLLKLFRYTTGINQFLKVVLEKRFEFSTLLILVVFNILVSSIAIYIFEGGEATRGNPNLITFFDAIYWAVVTMATVGYGDISPVTNEGRIIAIVLIFSGIAMFAFATSIVTTAFTEKMRMIKEGKYREQIGRLKNHIVICGFGKIGQDLASTLVQAKIPFAIIEKNPQKVEIARDLGYIVLEDDATHTDVLVHAGVGQDAKALVCLAQEDITNIYIALTGRSISPSVTIIAKANDKEVEKKFFLVGVDHIVNMYTLSTFIAAEYLGKPVAFEALDKILLANKDVTLDEIKIDQEMPICGQTLLEANFDALNLILIGIVQHETQKFIFNPSDDTVLYDGDMVIVMGKPMNVAKAETRFLGRHKRYWKQS